MRTQGVHQGLAHEVPRPEALASTSAAVQSAPAMRSYESGITTTIPGGINVGFVNSGSVFDRFAHSFLVAQVKVLQRSSKTLKVKWSRLCDAEKRGLKDPARHDVDFLQRFLSSPEALAALSTE